MKKSIIKYIVGGVVILIIGGIVIVKKIKDNKNIINLPEEDFSDITETEEETSEEVVVETTEANEEIGSAEMSSDEIVMETADADYNDTITNDEVIDATRQAAKDLATFSEDDIDDDINDDEVCNVEMSRALGEEDNIIFAYSTWLIQNNVSVEEAHSIIETITKIKTDMPEKYSELVDSMNTMMSQEFDSSKSQKFDKGNFVTFYGNLNPKSLFVTNGFKLIAMGGEPNVDMLRLASALNHLKKKNFDEFLEVMYEIYHTLNSLEVENINDKTYEENFKRFVDKYVKSNIKSQNKTKITEDFREVKEEGETK